LKILFATMPFDGHFKPLTSLAVHLNARGHEVRWYAGPGYAKALAGLGIPHLPFRRARDVNGENLAELHPERAKLKGPKLIAFEFEHVFVANCEAHFEDVEEIRGEYAFDVVVVDSGFYALNFIARKLDVPVYAVEPAPLMFNSVDAPPNFFGLKPARNPFDRVKHRVIHAMVSSTMKPGAKVFNGALGRHGLDPMETPRDFFDIPWQASKRCFQVGSPGLEFPRSDMPENIEFVGALLPHRSGDGPPLPAKLENHDSVILVSQGTVDNREPGKLIEPTLEALAGTEHLVVAATGGRNTAELRQRHTAENLVIEDFVDYHAAFPRTKLFVTNGGYGGVLLALSNGVPLLAAGVREGKNDVNVRVDYSGAGIDLRTEEAKPSQIAKGVERILGDPGYATRAAALRNELAGYEPLQIITDRIESDLI
jgi:MGT family glycosyltransferase